MASAPQQNGDIDTQTPTLVIDTSFGSTVGVVGHQAIIESDSRSHVERLQPNIARAVAEAGLDPAAITRIVVGTGPAPFTGLRAGIVAAKALAYATGAELIGQNILEVQHRWMQHRRQFGDMQHGAQHECQHVTLALNDARRHQLYYALYMGDDELLPMNIDFPQSIAQRVSAALAEVKTDGESPLALDIVGHGAHRYMQVWSTMPLSAMPQSTMTQSNPDPDIDHTAEVHQSEDLAFTVSSITDESLLDQNPEGLQIFAQTAIDHAAQCSEQSTEPLYLRRPDVSVPKPLKQVTHVEAHASNEQGSQASNGMRHDGDQR